MEAVSTADLDLSEEDIADLERYLDVNRGEILFARGVIVEGDTERFLIPVLAKQQGFDLDELGISVYSVCAANSSSGRFWRDRRRNSGNPSQQACTREGGARYDA